MIEPNMLLAFQSIFLVVLFVSMVLRMKRNYFLHGIVLIVALVIGWVATLASLPNFMDSSFMEPYMSPSSTLVVFGLHAFFGVTALLSGTWLVALWRPRSTDFAAKSKRIWQSTVILWVLAYVDGLLLYAALTTTFL